MAAITELPIDLPLAGVRVVDCATGAMAAIGRSLGELGAEVIRVEPPGGGADRKVGATLAGVSLDFVATNLGKKAIGASFDDPRFAALVAEADLLIEATRPGSDEAAALDAAELSERHPALVILSASDFGRTGPWAEWRASDAALHALTGGLSRSGLADRAPLLPPGDLTHECAAAQAVVVALSAFIARLRSGRGGRIDLSLIEAGMSALDPGFGISGSAQSGVPLWKMARGRMDERHRYPIIACADGFVRLCIMAPRQWRGMFEWMGRPEQFAGREWEKIQTRFRSPDLIPAIARFFADKTRDEIEAEAVAHGVPAAALLDLDEAVATPQMLASDALAEVEIAPGVTAPFPNGSFQIDGERAGIRRAAPDLTDHATFDSVRPNWSPPPDADRPLAGVKVLDLGIIVVGAETGRLLADQGADVVKVEHSSFPDGQRQSRDNAPVSITFAAGHRNKRGLSIDLRSAAGKAVFERLVGEADVMLSNFKPGTLDKLGLDSATLRRLNPRLVAVDSSAYGPTGPWSGRLGYGPLVRCSAGLAKQWVYPGEPESFSDGVTVYPDHVAARVGAIGALALLIRRVRTGAGGTASVSQAEVMLGHMGARIAALGARGTAVVPDPAPAEDWLLACAGDDEWCVVTVRNATDRRAFLEVTGADDRAGVARWAQAREPRAVMETLQRAGMAAGMMLRVVELPDQAQYRALGTFRETEHPLIDTPFAVEAAAARGLPEPDQRPAPRIGEDSRAVLGDWLGMRDDELMPLLADGAIEEAA